MIKHIIMSAFSLLRSRDHMVAVCLYRMLRGTVIGVATNWFIITFILRCTICDKTVKWALKRCPYIFMRRKMLFCRVGPQLWAPCAGKCFQRIIVSGPLCRWPSSSWARGEGIWPEERNYNEFLRQPGVRPLYTSAGMLGTKNILHLLTELGEKYHFLLC